MRVVSRLAPSAGPSGGDFVFGCGGFGGGLTSFPHEPGEDQSDDDPEPDQKATTAWLEQRAKRREHDEQR